MRRYFFDLDRPKVIADEHNLMFQDVMLAARFAEKLADDLSGARPELRGSASIIVRDSRPNKFTYCVAVR